MRTTTQNKNSEFKVVLFFFMNGWTLSYFDDKKYISGWVHAMREKHGAITKKEITNLKG